MAKELLTDEEIKFVENGKRWNIHFEVLFLILWVTSVVIPFVFMTKVQSPDLKMVFEDAGIYSFVIFGGLLITIVNQRWIRIVKKLMEKGQ